MWFLLFQLVQYLLVCNIANLEVLLDELAMLVADSTFAIWHPSIAGVIGLAYIAVDARPAFLAIALLLAPSWRAVLSVW